MQRLLVGDVAFTMRIVCILCAESLSQKCKYICKEMTQCQVVHSGWGEFHVNINISIIKFLSQTSVLHLQQLGNIAKIGSFWKGNIAKISSFWKG